MSKSPSTDLQQIYKSGTAKQLWDAWDEKQRSHFLIDHAGQFFELMGDDYSKSAKAYNTLTFDTLPTPIRKELVIHHAMGMYSEGGNIKDAQLMAQSMNDGGPISPAKQKLQDRIDTLKGTMAVANESAQKKIRAKIDKLQAQLDYNPSAKQRAQDNQGKFALDVPVDYSKAIYKKLWIMNIKPSILKLNGTASIVVNSRNNLNKAYQVYSGMSKEKAPALTRISRKL